MICQNLDSMLSSGKIRSPLLECRDDYQEFLIVDLVVDFGTGLTSVNRKQLDAATHLFQIKIE